MLRDYHERFAGTTGRLFSLCRDRTGATSYALLVRSISESVPESVLEIGCGDGTLLEAISDALPRARLVGMDLSPAELRLARERVRGATLVEGDSTAPLPFDDRSFDWVVSHLVVMLLGALDDTFSEAARVLKRGGKLAFVFDDLGRADGATYVELMRAGLAAAGREQPAHFRGAADARLYDAAALETFLEDVGFRTIAHHRFAVGMHVDADDLWAFMHASYPIGELDGHELDAAKRAVLARAAEVQELHIPLQLVIAERFA
ncbi:MAG: class I SAM-dependent methyltransferase [bacterium]|nr:class I SAM-dependent methyltransferase [bacterium]